jgi:hypothetical protein
MIDSVTVLASASGMRGRRRVLARLSALTSSAFADPPIIDVGFQSGDRLIQGRDAVWGAGIGLDDLHVPGFERLGGYSTHRIDRGDDSARVPGISGDANQVSGVVDDMTPIVRPTAAFDLGKALSIAHTEPRLAIPSHLHVDREWIPPPMALSATAAGGSTVHALVTGA